VHEAAVLGGPPEPPARHGSLLAVFGAVAVAATRTTPGVYPAVAVLLVGLMSPLAYLLQRQGRDPAPAARWLGRVGVAVPLLLGLPRVWSQPPAATLLWIVVYGAAAFGLSRYAADQLVRLLAQEEIHRAPRERLAALTAGLRSQGPASGARGSLLLHAVGRHAAAMDLDAAREELEALGALITDPSLARRRERLRSVVAFLGGDLEGARSIARSLLGQPADLEETRQYRAWAAYVEIAAGSPRAGTELAESALGPPAMAGLAWMEHCRALQAWALLERGLPELSLEVTRYVLNATTLGGSYRASLRALEAASALAAGDPAIARVLAESAAGMRADEPGFVAALTAPCLAGTAGPREALEVAERARTLARGPFAAALAAVSTGQVHLALGEPEEAARAFRQGLDLWPWLPIAEEGLAQSALARGDAPEHHRRLKEAARRYPEHRVALAAARLEGHP
jgi:tetratricopeptide (TPR) repeat protein